MLAEQLAELSGVFKTQLEGVIGRSLYMEGEIDVLKPKNRISEVNNNENKHNTKAYSSSKNPPHPTPSHQR
jgi:predicted phage tail protein